MRDAEVTNLKRQVEERVREGDIHDYLRQYDQAIVSYNNALDLDPDCADAWINKHNEMSYFWLSSDGPPPKATPEYYFE
ncbi:MAG: hypothetical protein H6R39_185 [Deltaproteobacteria bacterium]|nr:hypothetical protein [Deltaproteobacteria bacterium]